MAVDAKTAWYEGYNARCDDEDGSPEKQTENPYVAEVTPAALTFDEWLDQPQTVTTRRERLDQFMTFEDSRHTRELLMGWLIGAWNAGAENGIPVERTDVGLRADGKPLYTFPKERQP